MDQAVRSAAPKPVATTHVPQPAHRALWQSQVVCQCVQHDQTTPLRLKASQDRCIPPHLFFCLASVRTGTRFSYLHATSRKCVSVKPHALLHESFRAPLRTVLPTDNHGAELLGSVGCFQKVKREGLAHLANFTTDGAV